MRLEVLIDSEEPIIYPLNKNKLIIGSAESADIIINVDGVSRKHVILTVENDQYAVTDQGSTNGTYINEERLIPGKRVDFTSFFPVRLGDRVLLSLLSDDEDSPFSSLQEAIKKERTNPAMKMPSSDDSDGSTRMINLKQLQQSQATKKLQEQRKKVILDKKAGRPVGKKALAKPAVDKTRMLLTQIIVVLLVGGAIYFQFFHEGEAPQVAPVAQTPQVQAPVVPVAPEIVLVPEAELLSKESLMQLSQGIKCTTATEKSLCERFFPDGVGEFYGVIESPGFVNIFIDETPYYAEARNQMGILTPEALQKSRFSPEDWRKLAYIIFINNKLSGIAADQLPAKNINYIFVSAEAGGIVNGVMTVRSENYKELLKNIRPSALKTVKEYGLFTLDSIFKLIQIY